MLPHLSHLRADLANYLQRPGWLQPENRSTSMISLMIALTLIMALLRLPSTPIGIVGRSHLRPALLQPPSHPLSLHPRLLARIRQQPDLPPIQPPTVSPTPQLASAELK
jgi:hypothetical protein